MLRCTTPRGNGWARWKVHGLAALAIGMLACCLPLGTPGDGWAVEMAAGATPDSVAPPADPFPLRQRSWHLAGLGVDRWHASRHRGRGVKIAVLDSGFRGYRDHLRRTLPARVPARSFRFDGNLEARDSQHGILCGEVIHALAPETELLFANWEPDCPEQFLEAVRWARGEGAWIISCSLIMPSWSDGEGNGPVHKTLTSILEGGAGDADDLLCFTCAGNTAQRHWSGPFRSGAGGFHEWEPGRTDNWLDPWGDERVSVELCAPPGAGYQLSVHEGTTGTEVGRDQVGVKSDRCAVVRFQPERHHTYSVRLRRTRGEARPFHLVVLGGGLRHATARGSIPFPGDGPEVITVGAVDGAGRRLSYSSCGPNSCRPKPDLVAEVPFPSLWRPRPFSGTSAAAPQAAALAALLWSRHPDWTADEVRRKLTTWARDLGPPGRDWETGHGLIRLP